MSIKCLLRSWLLFFSWFSFFVFRGAEGHVFHIVPFRTTRCVLKSFRCLEFSNRVRNWNKFKNNIYVKSKLQLFQFELPIFINKLMCQSSLINAVSFVFWNLIVQRAEMNAKLSFLYDHHFKFPNRNTGFIFKVNQFECKRVFS
jgi:hypothetical protein